MGFDDLMWQSPEHVPGPHERSPLPPAPPPCTGEGPGVGDFPGTQSEYIGKSSNAIRPRLQVGGATRPGAGGAGTRSPRRGVATLQWQTWTSVHGPAVAVRDPDGH